MSKNADNFRLKYIFRPSYLAVRLREIRSVSDVFRRLGGVLIYIGYLARGFIILIWHRIVGLSYIVRGGGILIKEKVFGFFRIIAKAPIYIGHIVLNVCYRVRGVSILSLREFVNIYYRVRGLCIRGKEKVFNGARKAKKRFIAGAYKLQFFGDIYRDFVLKNGLADLNPIKNVRMKRMVPKKEADNRVVKPFRVLWLTHPFCNYKCTYCWIHGARPVIEDNGGYVKRSKEEYIRGWDNFNQRYGPANIEVIGGEPFLDADLPDILSAISVKNTVSIVTNLYWDPKIIIGKVDPLKLSFLVSFHPEHEPSVDRFIGKVSALQRAGFFTVVCIVVWPPFITRLSSWLKEFYFRGISVMIEPFVGEWMGRVYPNSYTAFEKEMIKDLNFGKYILPYAYDFGSFDKYKESEWGRDATEIDFATSFQFANISPKGKLCNAGVSYFRVLYNGMVRRCGHGKMFGDFFNGNFRLLDKPEPCELDKCDCLGENVCIEGGVDGPQTTGERVEGVGER